MGPIVLRCIFSANLSGPECMCTRAQSFPQSGLHLTWMMMVMVTVMVSRSPVMRHEGILEAVEFVRFSAILPQAGVTVSVVYPPLLRIRQNLQKDMTKI